MGTGMKTPEEVMQKLRKLGTQNNVSGMRKFGISGEEILGVRVPEIRKLAREIGTNHSIATGLWEKKAHEARILATMIEDPLLIDVRQANRWVRDIDSWDLCDHFCGNLIVSTEHADSLLRAWVNSKEEFVRRAGFVLMAELAVKAKTADDRLFLEYLELIENSKPDDRNFVKKAVSWALRQIGKRNKRLNGEAVNVAQRMKSSENRGTRWAGSDALRELSGEQVRKKLSGK